MIDRNRKDTTIFLVLFTESCEYFFYRKNKISSLILTKIVFYRFFSKFFFLLLARRCLYLPVGAFTHENIVNALFFWDGQYSPRISFSFYSLFVLRLFLSDKKAKQKILRHPVVFQILIRDL